MRRRGRGLAAPRIGRSRVSPAIRRALLTLHQSVGLVAALFLVVIAVSGSMLVFEDEIDRALNRSTSFVAAGVRPLPLETLVARVQSAYPDDRPVAVRVAEAPGQAYVVSLRSRQAAMVDPYTGAVLGRRDREKSFARDRCHDYYGARCYHGHHARIVVAPGVGCQR